MAGFFYPPIFAILSAMEKRKIIVIVGPTASGKTGWGVSIAKKFSTKGRPDFGWNGAEIISADSRQVYRGLDIGTGKDLKDYGEIPYHLIDICEPGVQFTMFDWIGRAREAIDDIFSRGKVPVVVGGTGLYVQALIEGFEIKKSDIKNSNIKFSREELENKSIEELRKIYSEFQILNFNIDENNPYRLIRAIERAQNGEVVSKKKPDFEALQIAIDMPREVLYRRIDRRVDEWFEEGFIEEVQSLIDAKVKPDWLEKIGLEYKILSDYIIEKRTDFDEMKSEMKFAIHAYARRQLTWFRRFPEIIWCKDIKSAEKEIKKFLK